MSVLPDGKVAAFVPHEGAQVADAIKKARSEGIRWLMWSGDPPILYDANVARIEKRSLSGSYVPNRIPPDASVVFVGASPGSTDAARRSLLAGPARDVFIKKYLGPAQLAHQTVGVANLVPIYLTEDNGSSRSPYPVEIEEWAEHLTKELPEGAALVAMGSIAAEALGDLAMKSVPHPLAIIGRGDSGEVERKMVSLHKSLTNQDAGPDNESTDADISKALCTIIKSDIEGFVSGVVTEPGTFDAERDRTSKVEIWKGLVKHMTNRDRYVGNRHRGKANAVDADLIEIFQYDAGDKPSGPWKGQEGILDGSLCVTMLVNDPVAKADVAAGRINAFSIGGRGKRTAILNVKTTG